MKALIKILTLAIIALVVSSCSIVRGLKTDGKNGPTIFSFEQREHDVAHTFGGIATTLKDLAKIGRLYLHNGMWDGKRIVSEEWIRQTIDFDSTNVGYHFNWYNVNYEGYIRPEHSGYYALGICNQVLYVNPDKNLVMVRIGKHNNCCAIIPVLLEQLAISWKE